MPINNTFLNYPLISSVPSLFQSHYPPHIFPSVHCSSMTTTPTTITSSAPPRGPIKHVLGGNAVLIIIQSLGENCALGFTSHRAEPFVLRTGEQTITVPVEVPRYQHRHHHHRPPPEEHLLLPPPPPPPPTAVEPWPAFTDSCYDIPL